MKTMLLLLLILLLAGCAAAVKQTETAPAPAKPLASANIRLDPITETKAILRYDRGNRIEPDGPLKAGQTITGFCKLRKHKVLVEGERPSGDRKWTKIIVFECIE